MGFNVAIVRAGHEFGSGNGAADLGDFLGAFVEQQDDEFRFRVVVANRTGDLLEQNGFATARRCDDETTLTLAKWCDQIDHAHTEEVISFAFEVDALIRKQRCEPVEIFWDMIVGDRDAFDFDHLDSREVLVAFTRWTHADLYHLADAQSALEALKQPERNTALGARYLRQLLDQWQGNSFLAIASYNAGPGAVQSWLGNDKPNPRTEPELWTEAIPYPETRLYTKKVLGNLWSYRRLQQPGC